MKSVSKHLNPILSNSKAAFKPPFLKFLRYYPSYEVFEGPDGRLTLTPVKATTNGTSNPSQKVRAPDVRFLDHGCLL